MDPFASLIRDDDGYMLLNHWPEDRSKLKLDSHLMLGRVNAWEKDCTKPLSMDRTARTEMMTTFCNWVNTGFVLLLNQALLLFLYLLASKLFRLVEAM
jgi:hypothetical protein